MALTFALVGCGKIELSFESESVTMTVGDTQVLTPIANKEELVYEWTSSNTAVVTVADGTLTAVGAGTAVVTVTVPDTEATASITITVNAVTITFADATMTIAIDQQVTLTPTVVPAQAMSYTWTTSDATVATVANGVVTGIAVGTATITASGKGGSDTIAVTVVLPDPTHVAITGAAESAKVGDTLQLAATILPSKASQAVVWSSSNTDLATVSPAGLVTFLAIGSVTITATSQALNTMTATAVIAIGAPDPETLVVTGTAGAVSVILSETLQMLSVVSPDLANQGVVWTTSDNLVATIDANGLLTALKVGTVTVTATSAVLNTVSGSLEITVILPDPVNVVISGPESVIQIEETVQLSSVVTPLHASQEVTYTSADPLIASVDANGLVTGVAEGTVIITVTSTALNTIFASYSVKVVAKLGVIDYSKILVDANMTAERYSTVTVGAVDYIAGVTAFTTLAPAFAKVVDGSIVTILAGTYTEPVAINVNNVTVLGPNEAINPVTDLEDRLPEAELTAKLTLGQVENIVIKGIKISGSAQIYSASALNNITVQNVLAYDSMVPAAEGVLFFSSKVDTDLIENVQVLDSSFNDTKNQGYRGVRINNAKNLIIQGCYFYRFFDSIRLEGTNTTYDANGVGPGVNGTLLIENNEFEMNIQYPIYIGRYSAIKVDILNNEIGVDPTGTGVFGLTNMVGFAPETGAAKTVVNIMYNNFVYNSAWHDVRFKYGTATAETLEINVNFNKFNEGVCIDPVDGACDYISKGSDAASVNNIINGQFNYFAVAPVASEFLGLNASGFAPYYTTLEAYEDAVSGLYVDPSLVGKVLNDPVTVRGLSLLYGVRAFATITEALAAAPAKATVIVLPGTYAEEITITKGVTLKSLNANLNPTLDDTAFLAASPTATTSTGVWYINDANYVTIKGFSFTGTARIRSYGASGDQYGFVYENNYAYDTSAATLTWKYTAYSAYGVTTPATTTTPGFINLVPNARWLHDFQFINNKFTNVADTNIFLLCVTGVTIKGNVFIGGTRDAIRMDYGSVSGVLDIRDNSFENFTYNGIYIRSCTGAYSDPLAANIYYNSFKNIGSAGATEIPAGTRIGAIGTSGYAEKKNAIFTIRYNEFENCTNYISLRGNVTSVTTWATKNILWSAIIEYNSFIDADGVTFYFQNLLNATDTNLTNVDTVYINFNYYGTTDVAKATITPTKFDLHKTAESNLVVYDTKAELDAGIATSYIPISVQITGPTALKLGAKTPLNGQVLPNTAPQTLVWSSADETIATVDQNGNVLGIKGGTVKIKAVLSTDETMFFEYEVVIDASAANVLVDAALATEADMTKITQGGKDYYVGVNAFDTLAEAFAIVGLNTVVYVNDGTYSDAVTIAFDNVSIIGPNAAIDPNTGVRVSEAIMQGNITIATGVKNVTIKGLTFLHNADTCKITGDAAGLIDGFNFSYNIVDGGAGDGSSGFIVFKQASADQKVLNFVINNNKFFSFGADRSVRVAFVENFTFKNNTITDASSDGVRLNDGGGAVIGKLVFTGNTLENIGQYGLFVGTSTCSQVTISGNSFINNGFGYAADFPTGAISMRGIVVALNGTDISILNNNFDRSARNDIRIDHAAAEADDLEIIISGNLFKTIPTDNYYYNGHATPGVVKTQFYGNTVYADDGIATVDPATLSDKIENVQLTANKGLFISEYGEGGSFNKWIEIYNPTAAAVNLGSFTLELYSNGSATVSQSMTFAEGTMLAPGDVIVIVHADFVAASKPVGAIENSYVINFNGDDAVVLRKLGQIVDIIGIVGNDPGTFWTVGTGDTLDNTLVRKATHVGFPITVFDPNDWDVYAKDDFTYMDAHVYTPA